MANKEQIELVRDALGEGVLAAEVPWLKVREARDAVCDAAERVQAMQTQCRDWYDKYHALKAQLDKAIFLIKTYHSHDPLCEYADTEEYCDCERRRQKERDDLLDR